VPVNFEVNDGVIALRMVGTYSTADLRAAVLDAISEVEPSDAIGMTFDVSRSESLKTRSAEEVKAMGYFLASHSQRFGRRIALIASGDFTFGMMRLGSATLDQEGVTNRVFRCENEGREWLRQR
jgi:hypothetical protein